MSSIDNTTLGNDLPLEAYIAGAIAYLLYVMLFAFACGVTIFLVYLEGVWKS